MKKADTSNSEETLRINAEPGKVVPKLVTKIGMATAENGNVILTFLFEVPGEDPQLVERIVIDSTTVGSLTQLLQTAGEEMSNAK